MTSTSEIYKLKLDRVLHSLNIYPAKTNTSENSPDFNDPEYWKDDIIERHPEIFFSDPAFGKKYCREFGLYATIKLFNKYGHKFTSKFKLVGHRKSAIIFGPRCISLLDLDYIIDNYDFLDYNKYAALTMRKVYLSHIKNTKDEMTAILERCIQMGAKSEAFADDVLDVIRELGGISSRWPILKFFAEHPLINVDISKIIVHYVNFHDIRCMDIKHAQCILDQNLDFNQDEVAKFALWISTDTFEHLHQTTALIDLQCLFNKQEHHGVLIECICNMIDDYDMFKGKTFEQKVDFIESFNKYNFDLFQIFNDYMNAESRLFDLGTAIDCIHGCEELLFVLAKKNGLLDGLVN
jgi:hypothetical protein